MVGRVVSSWRANSTGKVAGRWGLGGAFLVETTEAAGIRVSRLPVGAGVASRMIAQREAAMAASGGGMDRPNCQRTNQSSRGVSLVWPIAIVPLAGTSILQGRFFTLLELPWVERLQVACPRLPLGSPLLLGPRLLEWVRLPRL